MSDYTSWFVGMEVVCLHGYYPGKLVAGQTYTVSRIGLDGLVGTSVMVDLEGVEPGSFGPGWFASRFRPVQKRKTSIAIFQRLLDNPRVRISEDA